MLGLESSSSTLVMGWWLLTSHVVVAVNKPCGSGRLHRHLAGIVVEVVVVEVWWLW